VTTAASSANRQPDRVVSGVGGTGSGTGLAGAGLYGFGPETTLGKALILASPVTSVLAGSLLFYAHVSLSRWLENRAATRARKTIERAINNENLPEAERDKFRTDLAKFERGVVARELERVEAIGAVPEA
jgi:hypothetical protein